MCTLVIKFALIANMMKIRYVIWLVSIMIALFLGVVIYFQSSKQLIAFHWLKSVSPFAFAKLESLATAFPQIHKNGWIDYHLADLLWSSACASLIVGIWVNQFTVLKLLLVGTGCAIFYELLQLAGVTGGTFDWWDLFYSLIAGGVATLVTYFLLRDGELSQ